METPDTTPQQGGSQSATTPSSAQTPKEHSNGPLVSILIVLVILIAGAYYILTTKSPKTAESILQHPDAKTEALEQQSQSDDIADIEADATATDLDNLDSELSDIENELGANATP